MYLLKNIRTKKIIFFFFSLWWWYFCPLTDRELVLKVLLVYQLSPFASFDLQQPIFIFFHASTARSYESQYSWNSQSHWLLALAFSRQRTENWWELKHQKNNKINPRKSSFVLILRSARAFRYQQDANQHHQFQQHDLASKKYFHFFLPMAESTFREYNLSISIMYSVCWRLFL